ncbi:MAG: metal-dependent transcriptional regulator [Nitrospirae bacterium]|nr:metal-dependent transcriptional regulator [Nitrospirota bacterium]MBF0533692.1 metal-dependent transcriptional regulator [Nitrospirota bacterium]MBF0616657.1 metal-dependent transcriptional regulator [Nitrospirota bacterium]
MNNNNCTEVDEYLESLWYINEKGQGAVSDICEHTVGGLSEDTHGGLSEEVIEKLVSDNLVEIDDSSKIIGLTPKGLERARHIVRAHRLAERLLYDVMGKNIEDGACEFEHIVTMELVDSICTLLGHPKECPHGLPIPSGKCCELSAKSVNSSVIHLDELDIGKYARIAYVNCPNDQLIHRLNGLSIRPGVTVKLHQSYPTFVIECEGMHIALDNELAENICVWRESEFAYDPKTPEIAVKRRFPFLRKRRK